jgi:hypothetical protein
MKAKVIYKDYYTPDFEVGEVVEIMKGMETDTADIWNAPIGKAWLCKKQDGTFGYNIPLNLQIIEAEEEHWQDVRERAAIAALGGLLANTNLVSEVIKVAVNYANALVERLKEVKL